MEFQVSKEAKTALAAACEALIPALAGQEGHPEYWRATAGEFDAAGQILELMADQNLAEQAEFRQLLQLLDSRLAGLLFGGKWLTFPEMTLEQRGKVLRKWRDSRFNVLRKGFCTLKKLTMFLHYGSHRDHKNPSWKATGYQPLREIAPAPPLPIRPLQLSQDTVLDCDVVIVGSGAGGGLAAGLLAEAGQKVVLLEKGPFLWGEDFSQHEAEVIRKSYDKQGAFQTKDGSVTVFAGACLGGGTTINWTGAFPTPPYVRDEWARDHGLDWAATDTYDQHMARVMEAFHVNTENSAHNPQNRALWRGSEQLGEPVQVIARNVEGCAAAHDTKACGFCGLGCRGGHKQGTLATYIRRAAQAGAQILVGTEAQRILHAGGRAVGVEALHKTADGRQVKVAVRAKRVVLAAGSIHTPALLLRSGIHHPAIGRNLYFHPTVGVTGLYQELVAPWHGVMMSAVNKAHTQLEGNYGYWIETPPLHPGVGALAIPWEDALQHKQDLLRSPHMGAFIVLTRDKHGGRVTVDKAGLPVVDYRLAEFDRRTLLAGVTKAFELHRAAGASAVVFPHAQRHVIPTSGNGVAEALGEMRNWGWGPNQGTVFTAHQMGTCAMGNDPLRHAVNLQGELRALPGLFIADGSLLPSAAGVNPMMTIMAFADHVVQGMR